ncbi:MAG: UDP-2,3-diacylglucosamine diphosphatase [Magnetovibrionaceae bacterium]
MITDIRADGLIVISDLHVGSPYFGAMRQTLEIIDYAVQKRFDLCLNGDVFDIVQASVGKLAHTGSEVIHALQLMQDHGLKVYYVVGNHDIILENFFESWKLMQLSPFLNLVSGDRRIRIEHGHLYDPAFTRNPGLYQVLTGAAGLGLKIFPGIYKLYNAYLACRYRPPKEIFSDTESRLPIHLWANESDHFLDGARALMERGFDDVVFGHTHRQTVIDMGQGCRYFNTGAWFARGYFLEIQNGGVALRRWQMKHPPAARSHPNPSDASQTYQVSDRRILPKRK